MTSERWMLRLVVAGLLAVTTYPPATLAQSAPVQQADFPRVPRRPLGSDTTAAWSGLDPACKSDRLRDVHGCMQSFTTRGSIVGLVTLVDRAGFPVTFDAVGAYRENSIFQVQSIAKPFVAVLVLKLVEAGKIPSIDSRVSDLPGFRNFPHRNVTIRQLLTHTSGIWYRQDVGGVRMGIAAHLTNRLDKEPGTTTRDKTLEFVASHYANADLYPLGSDSVHYSNIAYTMLGWIVERLSGMPFHRYMQQQVFDPLGLKDSFYFPDSASAEQRARIVRVDRRWPDPPDYSHHDELRPGWVYPSPEGGLYSTASDLRTFMLLIRHRGQIPGKPRILSEASIAGLTSAGTPLPYTCNGKIGRTLAFALVREAGCANYPGLSAGTIDFAGRFSTEFWYDPKRDEIGIFLAQVVIGSPVYTAGEGEGDAFKQMLSRVTRP